MKKLLKKANATLKEDGAMAVVRKTRNWIAFHVRRGNGAEVYKDILLINGCGLSHPERYRVNHQIEQMESNGLTVDKFFYTEIRPEMLKFYRGVVIFRCPITPAVEELIEKAHYFNKKVFFDVDDLVIDTKYTNTIKYVREMNAEDRKLYDDGVKRMGETMKKCDYLITTTPALKRELEKYGKEVFVNKNVASDEMVKLSLPADLQRFESRIIRKPFENWKKLPEVIAGLDINLAPIEGSIFNEAKSENKWTEAALCSVVTVASDFGAFKNAITDEKDGVLCASGKDWYKKLKDLILHPEKREKIATVAHQKVMKEYVATLSGLDLTRFIETKLARNIAFVLPSTNISGGVNVVLKHCAMLRERGWDVMVINMDKSDKNIVNKEVGEVNVVSGVTHDVVARFDRMVATLYTTLAYVKTYADVKKKLYLVQNYETNFGFYGESRRKEANATYNAFDNIHYITISKWCEEWLKDVFGKNVKYAPNGLDTEKFKFKEREFKSSRKVKILVEGNSDDYYKNVDESFKIVEKLDPEKYEIMYLSYQGKPKDWYKVDNFYHKVSHDEVAKIYGEADILLKSSLLESFSYPPLEMMATGGYVVVVPNDGNVEYLKDGKNCLFYNQGDIEDGASKIEKLATDEKLRKSMIKQMQETVKGRDWKDIEKQILGLYE